MASLAELVARIDPSVASHERAGDEGGLRAAVAAIMREHEGRPELLFIKRAERESDPWSGHMAFPGGRRQETDRSLLHTAQRETLEEVGLDLTMGARPVGRLADIVPFSAMPHPLTVTAFLFALETPAELTLNEEVAAVVWAPLEGVLRGEGATTYRFKREGIDLVLPGLDVEGNVVWGLTYRMLELLRDAMLKSE
jgi:8-oxo-dGTP pyrophosphatase MutT (NUDIX family)